MAEFYVELEQIVTINYQNKNDFFKVGFPAILSGFLESGKIEKKRMSQKFVRWEYR